MTQTFQPGELVNVQLRGVRYVRHEPDGAVTVQTSDPDEHLWALPPQAAVERVAPKEWPPRAGDVWADRDDREWFGTVTITEDEQYPMLIASDSGRSTLADDVLCSHGPMRLVRRRGWTVDAPQTPAQVDMRAARVAGLRAFADLLESRTDLPAPYGVNGQVGFVGQEALGTALQLAASLGVELDAGHDTGNEVQRWARSGKLDLGGDVTLTLYAYGLDVPAPVDATADSPTGVVDEEPTGPVPLVDAEPTEAAGETVEDAEVTP